MNWDAQNALCLSGKVASLLKYVAVEPDLQGRSILYTSSIYQMVAAHQEEAAIRLGRHYIDEFRRMPLPFGPSQPLDGRVAGLLIKLLNYSGEIDEAIELCELALSCGVTDDGTKGGLAGRLERLKKKL